ncbi:MAG: NAD(P)H-hydrate epimerase [Calditrichaeota bacterium]|nr:NAD(P)H-hydrate epimerase [Calditrichota bacterium]
MRQVDQLAISEFGLSLLQMMENAGRALASVVLALREAADGAVLVLAGKGGNGGGGLCAARHLRNHGVHVEVTLAASTESLSEATRLQFEILRRDGLAPLDTARDCALERVSVVVDALIGYGLSGPPGGPAAELISLANRFEGPVVCLDVPSGVDATTGETCGQAVVPTHTVTLALPKTGLREQPGLLYLVDIGIPKNVFEQIGLPYRWPDPTQWIVELISGE